MTDPRTMEFTRIQPITALSTLRIEHLPFRETLRDSTAQLKLLRATRTFDRLSAE